MRASLAVMGIILLVLSSLATEYTLADNSPPFAIQWGSYGLAENNKFAYPQGIAVDNAGNVYVTDLGNRRVQEFDNNGNFLATWGQKGSGNGDFQEPAGITAGGGYIYVVDNELSLVQKFDMHGNFVSQWGSKGSNNGQFLLPQGIAVDSKGNVYVVDTGNSRVEKFDGNGTYLLSIGSSGLGEGQFLSPHGVAVDSLGFVYVSDTGNNRVEKFGQDGTFLQSYGESSGLKSPIGVSVDSSGDIFVADDGNNRIVEFESNGNMASWGSSGTGPNFFMEPRDVAVDSAGNVFVVDSDNNRIQKFGSLSQPSQVTAQSTTTASQTPQTTTSQQTTQQTTQPAQNLATAQTANQSLITDPNEKTLPQITAPPDMTVEATGTLTPVSIGQATATDSVKVVSITNNAPSKFPLGTTEVTWTAMNAGGNTAQAVQKITIVDTTPPTLTAPPNVTVQATSANRTTVNLGLPSSYDAVGVESVTNDAPTYFPLGQTVVTWKAIDLSGNVATAKQTVTVEDTTPPTIKAPGDITVNATGTLTQVNLGQAVANDDTGISSLTNNAPQEGFPLGTTTVTWTAVDAGGNTANATQKITVVNHTPPKLTPPPAVTFEATSLDNNTVPIGNATAADIEPVSITNNASKVFPLGKTVVLWTAKDRSGNTANATQVVDIVDNTPPKIIPPPAILVNATSPTSNTVTIGNASATDNTKVVSLTNNAPAVFPFGNTTVTWTAKDVAGNTATATQVVEVVDHTPPKLTIPADIVVNATAFAMPIPTGQATATGIIDTSPRITNNSTGIFHIGKTVIQWTAADKFGNTKTLDQTVNILACGKPESYYNVLMGTNGTDTLTGSSVPNLILGLEGNDVIRAGPAGDCIIAGNGNNVIVGGGGNDMIIAGNGSNVIKGGTGNELIYVGSGSNVIEGGSGHNMCYLGNPSEDTVVNCQSQKQ